MTVLNPQPPVAQPALGRRPHLVAEMARGVLDQHVLLAGEVAEEGRPADAGLGDYVLDPGSVDSVRLVEHNRRVVDAITLLGAAFLGGRRGQAGAGTPGGSVADQGLRGSCARSHIEYGTS